MTTSRPARRGGERERAERRGPHFPVHQKVLARARLKEAGEELGRRITPGQAAQVAAADRSAASVARLASGAPLTDPGPAPSFPFAHPLSRGAHPPGADSEAGAGQHTVRELRTILRNMDHEIGGGDVEALLSGGDPALALLDRSPHLRRGLRQLHGYPRPCLLRDLARAAAQPGCPLGALALGLLHGEGPHLPDTVREDVARAWEWQRELTPELPEAPLGLAAVMGLAGRSRPGTADVRDAGAGAGADADAADGSAGDRGDDVTGAPCGGDSDGDGAAGDALADDPAEVPAGGAPGHAPATSADTPPAAKAKANAPDRPVGTNPANPAVPATPADSTTPADPLAALTAHLATAPTAADRLAADLRNGVRPDPADLAAVHAAADAFDAAAAALGPGAAPEAGGRWTLDGLRAAHERAARLNGTRAELRALAALTGPEWCREPLDQVRDRAERLAADPAAPDRPDAADLVALAAFVRLATAPGDAARAERERLMPSLAERLPTGWHLLLALAQSGHLTLPAPDAAPTLPEPEPGPGPAAPDGTAYGTGTAAGDPYPAPAPDDPAPEREAELAPDAGPDADPGLVLDLDRDIAEHLLDAVLPAPRAPETPTEAPVEAPAEAAAAPAQDPAPAQDAVPEPRPEPEPVPPAAHDEPEPEPAGDAAALREGRFALAAWVRRAAGADEESVRVRELAAFAVHLNSSTTPLARRCQELVSSLAGRLGQDPADAAVAWAAAIRISLVAPSTQATTLVRELAPVVARGRRPLLKLSEVLAEAGQRGTFIVPEILGAVRDSAEIEAQCRAAARRAEELIRSGPQRRIRYQLATEVWHHLVGEAEVIGALCARVARDDPAELAEVRREVARLRDPDVVEREIDRATRQVARSRKRVDYGAREKLRSLIGEAVDVAAEWAECTGRLGTRPAYQDGTGWLVERVEELRAAVRGLRRPVQEAFAELAGAAPGPLEAAAWRAAARLVLEDAFRVLDGTPRPVATDDPDVVLRGELLLLPDLPVEGVTVRPLEPVDGTRLAALAALADTPPGWEAAFEARAARGDHVGTGEIVRVVRSADPDLAPRLRDRRERLITAARAELAGRLSALADRIDSGRRDGLLGEDDWSALTARAKDLADPGRYDFDRLPGEAGRLDADLDALAARARDGLRERLREASANPAVAAVADRISERVDASDLTTAEEFLAQAEAGKELPPAGEPAGQGTGFGAFFPALPAALRELLDGPRGGPGAADGPSNGSRGGGLDAVELAVQLRNAIEGAGGTASPQVRAVVEGLLRSRALPPGRIAPACKALNRWRNLAQGPRGTRVPGAGGTSGRPARLDANHLDNVRDVLRTVGVECAAAEPIQDEESGAAGRLWLRLTDLRLHGDPVLPQFGSLVSPTGRSLRVLLVWDSPAPSLLLDFAKHCPAEETVLVLYLGVLGPGQRRDLATAARRRRRGVVAVLDLAALLHLVLLPVPDCGELTRALAPFTAADPYTPKAAGDVPEEMFFGRDRELDEVLDPRGSCFVYGGRQLGKSALLRAARRQVLANDPRRVVVLESIYSIGKQPSTSDHLWNALWTRLADVGVLPENPPGRERVRGPGGAVSPAAAFTAAAPAVGAAGGIPAAGSAGGVADEAGDAGGPYPGPGGVPGGPGELGAAVHRGICAWIDADPGRQLLILLDEADDFLRFDAEERAFANVQLIRAIMEDTGRRAKVVFAGLHSTVRFESLSNQPLAHFGRPVSVGPLTPRDAHRLLTRPLAALGHTFEDAALPARVLALANNAPALVQLFAAALLERTRDAPPAATAPPRVITRADVEAVWEDRSLMSDFRERFLWTLNLDNRYRVIAYCVAHLALEHGAAATATSRELLDTCRGRWPAGFAECTSDEFAGLLGECLELGILGRDAQRHGYRLRTPNLLRLLGTREEIEQELEQAPDNLPLPRRFEGASYRPPYRGRGAERAPLTTGQIGRLFQPLDRCYLIAGSAAVHLGRVPKALEEAREDGVAGPHVKSVQRLDSYTPGALRAALAAPPALGHRVLVVNLRDTAVEEGAAAVDTVREALTGADGRPPGRAAGTRAVVLLTGPAQSALWARYGAGDGPVETVPVHRYDAAGLRLWMWDAELPFQEPRLQTELLRRTGGWPFLVHRVTTLIAGRAVKDREDAYARVEAELSAAPALLADRVGVRANPPLARAWHHLADLGVTEGEDPDLLAEMLTEADDPALAPAALRAHGYPGLHAVLTALRTLGALVTDQSGLLLCEPLLARLEPLSAEAGTAPGAPC